MSESLFQISCPSCESVFAVTDPELVGQIIACPKCGGMMLVEAAEVAKEAEITQDGGTASNSEIAQETETLANVEPATVDETAQDKRSGGDAQNIENSESAETGEEDDELFERPRAGKLVAGGIALALVGALTFGGLRVFKNESASTSETSVEAENSESGKDGEFGEDATGEEKTDVGGFAPRAVEERTGGNEVEPEFGADESIALEDGESASLGEVDENETVEDVAENAQDWSVAADEQGEETSLEMENGGDGEVGEASEGASVAQNSENASAETTSDVENAPSLGENVGELEDLDDLGALDEGESLDGKENEADDALANLDEEAASEETLAGSNAATGFNEADFERANQNDEPESADEPAEVDWSAVASTTNPTLQGALPTLRRERKEIDVDARLALPIKSIEFPSSPVAAIRVLSEFAGVSIAPDLETIVLTRPSTTATLDLRLRDTTAGEALEKVAELLNWEVCKEKDRILIRPSAYESETLVEERFDVADLTTSRAQGNDETRLEMLETPNNLTAEALAALIKSTVAPETWVENGGAANLTIDGTTLAISQNARNREKTRILLEGLRAIRGLEPQGDAAPERIIPEKLGWEKLTKKTTFMPLEPLPLQNAIEILEKSQKFQTLWDDATLLEAGVGRDSSTAARIEGGTLDAILREILEPLNANYLILGENLIFITESGVAKDYQTIEFFSLIGENGARPNLAEARALVEEIKVAIEPESWSKNDAASGENASIEEDARTATEAGNGETGAVALETGVGEVALDNAASENSEGEGATLGEEKAAIWLDVESSCLIVRQNQPNQRALRRWLAARLAGASNQGEVKAN